MAKKVAANGTLRIFPSRTQDKKKNPLDPDKKVNFMRKMFPDFKENIINDDEMRSIFNVLQSADRDFDKVNIIVGLIYRIGDIVENLNTGLIGKIIRRGTNHLICLTKEEYMFKSWIRDVMEYDEKTMERRMRVPGKPNTLEGTGGYLKNAMAATGTTSIKNFINKYKVKK